MQSRFWTGEEAAETSKAGVASEDTHLIPKPPSYIGKEAKAIDHRKEQNWK